MNVKFNCITSPSVKHEINLSGKDIPVRNLTPEEYMIYCARVSSKERLNSDTAPKLLKYLIDHKHWSPFEMISLGFEIETSRAIAQQLLRHRSFSFQEFSQRYAKVENIEPVELRMQAEKNRQSSTDLLENTSLDYDVEKHIDSCEKIYSKLIDEGVAKECARMVLPLATQTTLVMHGTLRSWIHFLDQRCDEHAQKEIRQIAFKIRNLLIHVCPWTAKALEWQSI